MRCRRRFIVTSLALGLYITLGIPAIANATTAEEVISQANDLKQKISTAQASYLEAVSEQGNAEAERDEAQQQYDDLTSQLDDKRERLASLMSMSYSGQSSPIADIMTNSKSVADLVGSLSRYNRIEDSLSQQTSDVADLQEQQAEKVQECEQKVTDARNATDEAQRQKQEFQDTLDSMSDEIKEVSSQLSSSILSEPTKAEQMQSLLDYMNNVYDITDTQARIITAAYQTSYAGSMRCEAWVGDVYEKAGFAYQRYASAYADYLVNCRSTDITTIKAGSLVFCSGSGTVWGHVGIALTDSMGTDGMDTLIIDNEGTRHGVVKMRDWLSWQKRCPNNGITGFFGWGAPKGVDLG